MQATRAWVIRIEHTWGSDESHDISLPSVFEARGLNHQRWPERLWGRFRCSRVGLAVLWAYALPAVVRDVSS